MESMGTGERRKRHVFRTWAGTAAGIRTKKEAPSEPLWGMALFHHHLFFFKHFPISISIFL
jgi:hypothetical protein